MVVCGALDTVLNKVLYTTSIDGGDCKPFDKPFTMLLFLFLGQVRAGVRPYIYAPARASVRASIRPPAHGSIRARRSKKTGNGRI